MGEICILILLSLQLVDIYTTYVALERKIGYEANPIVAKIMNMVGVLPSLISTKIVIFLPITYITFTYNSIEINYALMFLLGWYSECVLKNIMILRQANG